MPGAEEEFSLSVVLEDEDEPFDIEASTSPASKATSTSRPFLGAGGPVNLAALEAERAGGFEVEVDVPIPAPAGRRGPLARLSVAGQAAASSIREEIQAAAKPDLSLAIEQVRSGSTPSPPVRGRHPPGGRDAEERHPCACRRGRLHVDGGRAAAHRADRGGHRDPRRGAQRGRSATSPAARRHGRHFPRPELRAVPARAASDGCGDPAGRVLDDRRPRRHHLGRSRPRRPRRRRARSERVPRRRGLGDRADPQGRGAGHGREQTVEQEGRRADLDHLELRQAGADAGTRPAGPGSRHRTSGAR